MILKGFKLPDGGDVSGVEAGCREELRGLDEVEDQVATEENRDPERHAVDREGL